MFVKTHKSDNNQFTVIEITLIIYMIDPFNPNYVVVYICQVNMKKMDNLQETYKFQDHIRTYNHI